MIQTLRLTDPALAHRSGRGVGVAVVDSGVHASHPHVGSVAGGIAICPDLSEHPDYVDRLGHGTAVTAAIREKAPDAELWIVKVFDRALATPGAVLVRAIDWAIDRGLPVVNLSLGTANPAHEPALSAAVQRALRSGTTIVAADPPGSRRWLPGRLPGVVAVALDWSCARDEIRVEPLEDQRVRVLASGYPRPIPGVPPERNLQGVSFAVANATGFVARAFGTGPAWSPAETIAALAGAQRAHG